MMPPVGMLAPLPDVLLVMGAEVVTILSAKTVLRPALIVAIAIIHPLSLIPRPATIVPRSVLRHSCACENRHSGAKRNST